MIATLTAATIASASMVAMAQGTNPPVPRPAAGALPQSSVGVAQGSSRAQTAEEQKASASGSSIAPQSSRTGN
jgi:hypothetical protein